MRIPMQRTAGSATATPVRGDHAVVLGASMAGLLAARVLADHFAQVTIVERDQLPQRATPRPGVPQGRHIHLVLPRGSMAMEELFPGLLRELVEAGAPVLNSLAQVHFETNGHVLFHDPDAPGVTRPAADGMAYEPSRPLLEATVRARVLALPNIAILEESDVAGLTTNPSQTRVTGAVVAPRGGGASERKLDADLVVAATGRSGRVSAWLKKMNYPTAPEEELRIDLKYVTQRVRVLAGSMDHLRAVVVSPVADRPTGAGAIAQEAGSWIVTLYGYGGHHPPLDREAWLSAADGILPRHVAEGLRAAEPLEDLHQHRFPANLRRRYERLDRFPEGLLVSGDALCSFNPIYGQGMTVAALEALAMRDALCGGGDLLARRYFKAAAKPIASAWASATGADLGMPAEIGPGPRPLPLRAVNRYVDRFQAAAEHDPVMAWRFLDVTGLTEPESALFAPDSLRRIAASGRRRRRGGSLAVAGAGARSQERWP